MRAFVALALPQRFGEEVERLSQALEREIEGRFLDVGSRNVVLAFLGDISDAEITRAIAAMNAAVGYARPVPLRATKLGKFGKKSNATLWLGVEECAELGKLVEDLRGLLDNRGLAFDKRFEPHITLARHAKLFAPAFPEVAFPAEDVACTLTLYKSEMNREGARYIPIHSVGLIQSETDRRLQALFNR